MQHDSITHTIDVAVIGGGLAGLAAAAAAGRAGATVAVFESNRLGGRASTIERDGYLLNEGAHSLYLERGGQQVLDALGVHLTGRAPDLADYHTIWNGEIRPLPVTPAAILTSRLFGTRSKTKLVALFGGLRRSIAGAGHAPFGEWMDSSRVPADVQKFLLTVLRLSTYCAEPEHQSATAMLRVLAAKGGVRYIDGGWRTIVAGLATSASTAGATIRDHAPVTSVRRHGLGWEVGVVLDGEQRTFAAANVVFAAGGPTLATRLLGDDPADWVVRSGPAVRAACLDIGTDLAGSQTGHSFLLSSDEPLYLSRHAPVADLAPTGSALTSLLRYLPSEAAGSPTDAAAHRESLERHAAAGGVPAPPERRLERFLAAPVVAWGSPLAGLHRPDGTELADTGVFAAGDWVGDALLADASLVSGHRCGQLAAERARLAA